MLDMRGLYITEERRVASPEERDYCFSWIARQIGIDYETIEKSHGKPTVNKDKFKASDKTRLTFENPDHMREWKKFINVANTRGKGIHIWNKSNKPYESTKLYWVEILS